MRARVAVVRIPDSPRALLAAAAAMSRLRAQWEAGGGRWFSLEEECTAREGEAEESHGDG